MIGGHDVLTRRFAADRAAFVVSCPDEDVRSTVEALFADLPVPDDDEADAAVIRLLASGEGLLGVQTETRDVNPQDLNGALASVVTIVSRMALDADPDHLHLHCATISKDGRGILISAPSGTGKTTLAGALVAAGWTYTSDEAASLRLGNPTVAGFPKPLLMKPGGTRLIPALAAAAVATADHAGTWLLVPVGAIPVTIAREVEPRVVVVLYRALDGDVATQPIATAVHPVDMVVSLMSETMDAARYGSDTVRALADLAARCQCISMSVGPLDQCVALLDGLVDASTAPLLVRDLTVRADHAGTWLPAVDVRSVLIGERAVAHDTVGGAIVAFDEAGTALWRALYGEPPSWWPSEAMATPTSLAFVQQLADHGLVRSTIGRASA